MPLSQKTDLELLSALDGAVFWDKAQSSLNDKAWLECLEEQRGRGRNDYPIKRLWHSILKVSAFKLGSIQDLSSIESPLPPPSSFSRFISSALKQIDKLDQLLFESSDIGPIIALGVIEDTKERHTYLFDADTGLPFFWHTGPKIVSPIEQALELLEKIPSHEAHFLIAPAEYEILAAPLWEDFKIKPIIPTQTTQAEKKSYKDILYDFLGQPYCHEATLIYAGFEEARNSLKFRCAADHYGYRCSTYDTCTLRKGIRIPLSVDPSTFTPLPRFSYRWERLFNLYKKEPLIKALLLKSIPLLGKKELFLRVSSLLFAAAYRTKKLSKLALN